jgi:16S rRNA (uracil1498-N3)-methyltransferase
VEKAVELGVNRIVPVVSARAIVRIPQKERPAKAERWRRIAEDAARQSDAVWLPDVLEAVDFPEALAIARKSGRVFAGALVSPPPPPILTALASTPRAKGKEDYSVFIGPEGDFTPEELAALLEFATPVSLGPTVLRAETAAIFAASVLAAYAAQPL